MGKVVLNLSEVVAAPVISGENSKYIWTGVVKSENITPLLIKDDIAREKFTKLVKDLERSTRRYRTTYDIDANFVNLMNDESLFEEAEELEDHIINLGGKIKEYLGNSDKYGMDMDLFWILLCRDYEEILEKNPDEFKAMSDSARRTLRAFKKNLNENDPCVTETYIPELNKYVCYQFLTRGQEKKYMSGDNKNDEKLSNIIRSIAGKEDMTSEEEYEILKELATGITVLDLSSIFKNPRHAEMQFVTLFKNYLLRKGYTSEQIEAMSMPEITDKALETYNSDKIEFHSDLVAESIMNNIDYLDLEKLLLVATIRPLEAFEVMAPKVEGEDLSTGIVQELSKKAEEKKEIIDSHIQQECTLDMVIEKTKRVEHINKKILESGIITKKTKFNLMYSNEYKEVSLKRLEELMSKFCDGMYLTDIMELNLKYIAYFSENEMANWSDELVSRMSYSEDDIFILSSLNFENFKRLYAAGKIKEDHIEALIRESGLEIERQSKEDVTKEVSLEDANLETIKRINLRNMFKDLYNSELISEDDIVEYFKKGVVTPEMIYTLEENKSEEELKLLNSKFKKVFNKYMILSVCEQYSKEYIKFMDMQETLDENSEELKEQREIVNCLRKIKDDRREVFNRYNADLTEEEKHLLGDELLETYYIEMNVEDEAVLQESIKTLYEDGMIDLENIIGLDKKYVIPMLDTLSLEDASKVRNSMTFKELEEMLDDIFSDESFSDERKFIIVMNLLGEDSEEDKTARDFYLSMLEFDDVSERKAQSKGGTRNVTGNTAKDSNKYIYPDFVKWKFYKGLDKDVRVTRYANGFVEFASSKLGARIIEKYYDGDKPAYGTATYILPEQEYRKNQSDLITITRSGNIMEGAALREITPRKDRVAHRTQSVDRTWMDEIVKYFDIDYERENDTRYSKEELKALQDIVKRYKTEYEPIK